MRIVKFVLLTIVAMILWAVLVVAGTLEGWWHRPLAPKGDSRAFMDAIVEEANANYAGNVALALVHDGKVIGDHFASKGEAVDADTAFQVASLSKWVTAWGVMALVEDGKVDLDAPIEAYLTRWSLPPSEFDHTGVTARRLLSHTSGLTDGMGYAGFEPGTPVQTLEASLTHTADASPGASVRIGFEPGSAWQYSGGSYTLLQLLIEEVAGESFEAYMQRRILRPLGMSCSTYLWDESSGIKLATFYDVDSSPAIHYRYTASAAASLYTTLRDMTTFVQAQAPPVRWRTRRAGRAQAGNAGSHATTPGCSVRPVHLGAGHRPICQQQCGRLRDRARWPQSSCHQYCRADQSGYQGRHRCFRDR